MTGLVIDSKRVAVPGVEVVTWLDDPKRAPPVTDGVRRKREKVQAICLHTTRGAKGGVVRDGARPSTHAETLARYQATTLKEVSWHLTIDTDGTVVQSADLATWMTWHAGHVNGWTVGVELVQQRDTPDLWRVQLDALVAVCSVVSDALAIPRRVLVDAAGAPVVTPVRALLSEAARGPKRKDGSPGPLLGGLGQRWAGVIGHCQVVPDHVRGPGDPGPLPFAALLAAGWQGASL